MLRRPNQNKKSSKKMTDILFHGDIGWEITSRGFAEEVGAADQSEPIRLLINSGGGLVTDGIAMLSALRRHPAGFVAEIEGFAGSMAAMIAMEADSRTMAEDAWLMFHRVRGGGGTAPELVEQAKRMEQMEARLVSILSEKLGVDSEEVVSRLDSEIWLRGDEALAAGLVDELTPALEIAAHIGRSEFQNPPKGLVKEAVTSLLLDEDEAEDARVTAQKSLIFAFLRN